MEEYYPITLRLEGKKVVVIGGGRVAERKVKGLLGASACITMVSPEATEALIQLADNGSITWLQKSFSKEDIKNALLIYAASNDAELNQCVKKAATDSQLVTIADDPEGSDFHIPASIQRGRLNIAVSTGGASPTLAREIRKQLEEQYDETYEYYLEFLYAARGKILKEVKDASLKRKLLAAIAGPEFLNSHDREADFEKLLKNKP